MASAMYKPLLPPYTLTLTSTRMIALMVAKNAVALIIRENFEKNLLCLETNPAIRATKISAIRKYQSDGENTDERAQESTAVIIPQTAPSEYDTRIVPHRFRYAGSSKEKAKKRPRIFSPNENKTIRIRLFHLFMIKDSSHP